MTAAESLAQGFAAHVRRWSLQQSASAPLAGLAAQAAHQLGLAMSEGHVCVQLADLKAPQDGSGPPPDAPAWRQALLAAGVAGTPAAAGAMPLIVDDDGRLYLHRYFDLERRLASRVRLALRQPPAPIAPALAEQLARLFPGTPGEPDGQKLAAALALRQRFTVISGGPGTGKTTTVVLLLACLLVQDPACRIRLAAPTGKAAARMQQALRQRALQLFDALPAATAQALRAALPAEAFTVHRLLGIAPGGAAGPVPASRGHHACRRLPLDVLVVDEASMLDLSLATRLLEAVPDSARIILLGDHDQLAAVESGAVFAELSADPRLSAGCIADLAAACGLAPASLLDALPVECVGAGAGGEPGNSGGPDKGGPLQDSTVWLRRNFRFAADSGIGRCVAATQRGDGAALQRLLQAGADDLRWLDDASAPLGDSVRQALRQGFAPYLAALRRDPRDHAAMLAAFDRFRVLCAVREGPRGVLAVNELLLRELPAAEPRSAAVLGQPLMVLRNDALLGLFNGDIGLILPGDDGRLGAVFPAAAGGSRWLPALQLPAHETAFALTVHKAQGSEFDELLLLLPATASRVLGRELLYTALSRARQHLTVVAPGAVLAAAAAAPTQRHSGLGARLREA